jgi:tRNA pseudouridine32 synthase/23S rRNA pseudouridine746 synthase
LLEQSGHEARYLLQPLTGPRHQLRVHMSALGLPIRGDRIYPTLWPEPALPDYSAPLQLLACGLSFIDPVTRQSRRFELGRKLAF